MVGATRLELVPALFKNIKQIGLSDDFNLETRSFFP